MAYKAKYDNYVAQNIFIIILFSYNYIIIKKNRIFKKKKNLNSFIKK